MDFSELKTSNASFSPLKEFDFPNFKNSSFRLDRPSAYLLNRARNDEINGYIKLKKSMVSATIYIGRLTLNTTEEQLFELFSQCGQIQKVIMGLNAHDQSPTGFCFIIFKKPQGALNAIKYLNKTKINGKPMEIDLDPGFEEGRQYGRAENGAQKQPYKRNNYGRFRRDGRGGRGGRGFRGGRGSRGGRGGFNRRERSDGSAGSGSGGYTANGNKGYRGGRERENYGGPRYNEEQRDPGNSRYIPGGYINQEDAYYPPPASVQGRPGPGGYDDHEMRYVPENRGHVDYDEVYEPTQQSEDLPPHMQR